VLVLIFFAFVVVHTSTDPIADSIHTTQRDDLMQILLNRFMLLLLRINVTAAVT